MVPEKGKCKSTEAGVEAATSWILLQQWYKMISIAQKPRTIYVPMSSINTV
jgi:hypothetical protein